MATIPVVGLRTHTQEIQSLYKRALRTLLDYHHQRHNFRYHAVLLRKRFDDNKNIQNMSLAKQLLADGERELYNNEHYQPFKFPEGPGGTAYQREHPTPDWVLDYWVPLEKAQYPDYFARREQRKKEYVRMWEKKYGKPAPGSGHHH